MRGSLPHSVLPPPSWSCSSRASARSPWERWVSAWASASWVFLSLAGSVVLGAGRGDAELNRLREGWRSLGLRLRSALPPVIAASLGGGKSLPSGTERETRSTGAEASAEIDGLPGKVTKVYVGHPHGQNDDYIEVIAAHRPPRTIRRIRISQPQQPISGGEPADTAVHNKLHPAVDGSSGPHTNHTTSQLFLSSATVTKVIIEGPFYCGRGGVRGVGWVVWAVVLVVGWFRWLR